MNGVRHREQIKEGMTYYSKYMGWGGRTNDAAEAGDGDDRMTTRSRMTTVALALLMCLVAYSRAWAQTPSIPVSQVKVVGSSATVLGFPATAQFDSFGLVPGTMTIRTSGTAHWRIRAAW